MTLRDLVTTKRLDRDAYLKALALFTIAHDHYRQGTTFEGALARHLGVDRNDLGHISDAVYSGDITFDEALKREGYTWEDVP